MYEYDSIRFYIETMEINARFSHAFIVRITGFSTCSNEDCVLLDARERLTGELQEEFPF